MRSTAGRALASRVVAKGAARFPRTPGLAHGGARWRCLCAQVRVLRDNLAMQQAQHGRQRDNAHRARMLLEYRRNESCYHP